jgi:hypothetical protein
LSPLTPYVAFALTGNAYADKFGQTKRDASTDAVASKLAQPTPSYAATASTFPAGGLSKRFDHAKMTFYDVGLGACGRTNQPADFVVALNAAQYDSGHHCGQRIQIRANGKTAVAQVVDRCTGCEGHGLDLSKGLFSHFADANDGVFVATWDFISDHHVRFLVSLCLACADGLCSVPAPGRRI